MSNVLTKRYLLNLLENIGMDEEITVMVNKDHLEMFVPEPAPHLLPHDIINLQKMGTAKLSIGAGLGGEDGGLTLSTVKGKS